MRHRATLLMVLGGLMVASCGGGESVSSTQPEASTTTSPATTTTIAKGEAVCALNEDFEELNERTVDMIPPTGEDEPIPASYAELLEENYIEGVNLMRQMVEVAPDTIRDDLAGYTRAIAKLSEMYAEYDYDQAAVWENADYDTFFEEYAVPDEVRARLGVWFTDHCGIDLHG